MFCCGPCDSMDAETQNLRWMKPYNGGRYRKRTWSMLDGGQVDLLNIRTCAMCNDRYHEQIAEQDDAWEDRDARAILRKFGQCSKSNVPDDDADNGPDNTPDDDADDDADNGPDNTPDDAPDASGVEDDLIDDFTDGFTDDFIMI